MQTPPVVLLVDDEPKFRKSLGVALGHSGFEVVEAGDGLDALGRLAARDFDVVVLDVSMPVLNGFETCRRMRAAGREIPVLMLTARDDVDYRVMGLEAGADDYLTKPFALRELVARLHALVRRAGRTTDDVRTALQYDDLRIDRAGRLAWRGDRELALTRTEFLLLEQLAIHSDEVVERERLYLRVWGFEAESNSLGVYIGYLRKKLEAAGEPRLIWTVRSVGYVLRTEAGVPGDPVGKLTRREA